MALAAVRSKAVVLLLLLTCCLLSLRFWESVIVICFVVRYFISLLVLQLSWWGRESWLLCLVCLPGVSWWLSSSSSRCHGVVCGLWLWYFLIILTCYFWWYHVWRPSRKFSTFFTKTRLQNSLNVIWLDVSNCEKSNRILGKPRILLLFPQLIL